MQPIEEIILEKMFSNFRNPDLKIFWTLFRYESFVFKYFFEMYHSIDFWGFLTDPHIAIQVTSRHKTFFRVLYIGLSSSRYSMDIIVVLTASVEDKIEWRLVGSRMTIRKMIQTKKMYITLCFFPDCVPKLLWQSCVWQNSRITNNRLSQKYAQFKNVFSKMHFLNLKIFFLCS